jgi:hypothetical protein
MTPKIDKEFHALIPPLQPEELAGLEAGLKKYGCLDALKVWEETGILLDGHNRLAICTRLNLAYRIETLSFADRLDAKLWMVEHQLGRRNLAEIDHIALASEREDIIAEKAKANKAHGQTAPGRTLVPNSAQAFDPTKTRDEAAKLAGVGHDTYTKGKAVLAKGTPELVQSVREGSISIHAASALVDLPEEEQNKLVKQGRKAARAKATETRKARAKAKGAARTNDVIEKARARPMPEPTVGSDEDRAFLASQPIRRVVNVAKFDADAVAYRISSEVLADAWKAVMDIVGQRTEAGMGPYMLALKAFRAIPEPACWCVCNKCEGKTHHKGPCASCNASGYKLKNF